jgi:hypothetical protein
MCSTIRIPSKPFQHPISKGDKKKLKEAKEAEFKSYIAKHPKMLVYGLLLSQDPTHPITDVINDHWYDIHYATGDDILIILYQAPPIWIENYKNYWKNRIEYPHFDKVWERWQGGIEPGIAYSDIDLFNPKIKLTQLPCLALFTDINDRKAVIRSLPFLEPNSLYKFLLAIFEEIKTCCENQEDSDLRSNCLRNALTSPSARVKEKMGDIAIFLEQHPAQISFTAISFLLALASQNLLPLAPWVMQGLMSIRDTIKQSNK